jgi:hypothetical protein
MTLEQALGSLRQHFQLVDFDHPQDRRWDFAPDGQKYKLVKVGPATCSDGEIIEAFLDHVVNSDEFPNRVIYWRETPLISADDDGRLTLECRMVAGGPTRNGFISKSLERASYSAAPKRGAA